MKENIFKAYFSIDLTITNSLFIFAAKKNLLYLANMLHNSTQYLHKIRIAVGGFRDNDPQCFLVNPVSEIITCIYFNVVGFKRY